MRLRWAIKQACAHAVGDLDGTDTNALGGLACLRERIDHMGMQTFVSSYMHKHNFAHGRHIPSNMLELDGECDGKVINGYLLGHPRQANPRL